MIDGKELSRYARKLVDDTDWEIQVERPIGRQSRLFYDVQGFILNTGRLRSMFRGFEVALTCNP